MDQEIQATQGTGNEMSWDDALNNHYGIEPENDTTPIEAPEEPEIEETTENSSSEENSSETQDLQPESNPEPQPQPEFHSQRDFITSQREYAQEMSALKEDLWEKTGFRNEIVAGEEVITDYRQLLGYENPRTGEAFTEEEAAAWFMDQSQKKAAERAEIEKTVNQVAEVNLDLKTGAVEVMSKYGDFLSQNPELKAEIYAEFQKTLVKSQDGETVLAMPVDIVKFYDFQLRPYIELENTRKEMSEYKSQAEKANAERQKAQYQTDRGDILLGSQKTTQGGDKDEWAAAAEEYYAQNY